MAEQNLDSLLLSEFGTISGTEVVSLGHPDLKAALLSHYASAAVQDIQDELGLENIRRDIKVGIAATRVEVDSKNGHPSQHAYVPQITINGNLENRPEYTRYGGWDGVLKRITDRVKEASHVIGYSLSGLSATDEADSRISKQYTGVQVNISPQSYDLVHNAEDNGHTHGGGVLPDVFGDGGVFVAGANLDSPELVSNEIVIARRINENLTNLFDEGKIRGGYDGKVQVAGEMDRESGKYRIREVNVSKQNDKWDDKGQPQTKDSLRDIIWNETVLPALNGYNTDPVFAYNTAGEWNDGGEAVDMGEGCDHIFWANTGYHKSADPQVGEDPTKADNIEFMMRALSKTALEVLKDYGAYEVIARSEAEIGQPTLKWIDLEIMDRTGKLMFTDNGTKRGLIKAFLADDNAFPIDAKGIMQRYWVRPLDLIEYMTRGNIYGYTADEAPDLPWENVTRYVNLVRGRVEDYISSTPYLKTPFAPDDYPIPQKIHVRAAVSN
ncbi:MAG: hypothetical protein ABIC95_03645 [archaeon]